ncbi:hypothetical protein A3B42_00165 [Candidatus Daviesbacteria bacterium RIFCSPLOWO2_01_FULL_38_10]|nr:MAG: hypothetical protein A3B42_00165 [Candidatus Daviesbacteria bacterium RIFCSPLOWO2_01_FULL_38_10]OGE45162.1 MAG: hypothetical protein A3E67_03080 [Candidatus Daviesbacteria bacterium RIFCSPHIGHO2_12_FULL_38_25]OGE68353.1 MAG: hypothetical protein A3H81_02355 [Candidatus Daviesbacteria bacterium RIFCSPLOWO2_02_FULL_38_18]OGE72150.1 MAG: hypothetical protein A3H18_01510 [Candidatus Daviesbacteria bacterium RIFCSPLOWO2_12_FULL_38_10]HCB22481.1 hypothetical protein [Candidatus Daviesbacteria
MRIAKLNKKQLDKLSDIASDLALVAVASVILPAALDKFNLTKILLGSVASIIFWLISLWFRR